MRRIQIVGQYEATTGTRNERQYSLNKKHQDMTRFRDANDNDYDRVAGAIYQILDDYENGRGPAINLVNTVNPVDPDPQAPDYQNGLGPGSAGGTSAPTPQVSGQVVQTRLFATGNICGDPNCGRTRICAADYNRRVNPMGYPGLK